MAKTILVLVANPSDTPRLRLEQEVRDIQAGLERAKRRDDFVLKSVWAVRPTDLRRALLDHAPAIVHFCGHGGGEDGIAFEDDNSKVKLVSTKALADLFALFADSLECVLLNACYSEVQADAIAASIPHVIGMSRAISDPAAIEFAVAFYDALAAGKPTAFAYQLACNALQLEGLPEHQTPVLKSKPHPPQNP